LQRRRSCNLLTRSEMEAGKTPTTPTVSSIIAGVQCQEAVKLLHGLDTLRGHGWVFQGVTSESYKVQYQRKPDCYSHDILDEVVPLDRRAADTPAIELLKEARRITGEDCTLEFARDVLEKLVCPQCGGEETMFVSLGRVPDSKAYCPKCEGVRREAVTFYKVCGDEHFRDTTLAEIGIPPFDVVFARSENCFLGLELAGDATKVLGPLVGDEESVEWT